MSRVCLNYDDGTKTDFNDVADALYHVAQQGAAGVVNITNEKDGTVVVQRRSLDPKVREIVESDAPLSTARKLAKE
jgi:nucleoside-diphosphate-sugar epimerase